MKWIESQTIRLFIVISAVLYFYHAWVLITHSVDMPKYDDWTLFTSELTKPFPPIKWFYAQYLEHRYAMIKFVLWLLYQFGNRDFLLIQWIGFGIYGVLLFSLGWILWKGPKKVELEFVFSHSCWPHFSLKTILGSFSLVFTFHIFSFFGRCILHFVREQNLNPKHCQC